MTAIPCPCPLCNRSRRILAEATANVAAGARSTYDGGVDAETRLRPGLSRGARRAERSPRLFIDSMGYGSDGRYYADKDGDL